MIQQAIEENTLRGNPFGETEQLTRWTNRVMKDIKAVASEFSTG